jgi:hypothetical protein
MNLSYTQQDDERIGGTGNRQLFRCLVDRGCHPTSARSLGVLGARNVGENLRCHTEGCMGSVSRARTPDIDMLDCELVGNLGIARPFCFCFSILFLELRIAGAYEL